MDQSPYLSVIVTSRNDDPRGELIKRMQSFINALFAQCQKYKLNIELILVEWNPPEDRPRLSKILTSPQTNYGIIRIIEVPPKTHKYFKNSSKIPIFQMIAKNVGIRRSKGQFVLATNIDILFSNELIEYLASHKLQEKFVYRIDRYDVPDNIFSTTPIDSILKYCDTHVVKINTREGTIITHENRLNDLLVIIKNFIHKVIVKSRKPVRLHTNACGDFTLLGRREWFKLKGYPEYNLFAAKIDGLLCYAAYYSGLEEKVLNGKLKIYHVEHVARNDGIVAAISALKQQAGIDNLVINSKRYNDLISKMSSMKKPIILNKSDNWGLPNIALEEYTV
jgi:hypothetical protein